MDRTTGTRLSDAGGSPGDRGRPTAPLRVTVVEPEERAPLGRLEEWLLDQGASLRMVRLWRGEAVPALSEVDDLLVVLGGAMSAHDDADHPWLADLRRLLRDVVREQVPALAVCLGAQVAAEALGGQTAVPSPYGREGGVVGLRVTDEAWHDPLMGPAVAEAARVVAQAGAAATSAEGPAQDGGGAASPAFPVIVSHDDVVIALPDDAVLLASSHRAPVQAWRAGLLLALQHHPESFPQRVGYWQARAVARRLGAAHARPAGSLELADMPEQALAAGRAAQAEAEAVDPVVRAFGRALTRTLVDHARGRAQARAGESPADRREPSGAQPEAPGASGVSVAPVAPGVSQSSSASMTS